MKNSKHLGLVSGRKGAKEDIKDDERSDTPTTPITNPDVEEVSHIVIKYRRLTVRKLADEINMNRGTAR
jgi:hypothetical protein